jgi:lipid A disaccharide synthetase
MRTIEGIDAELAAYVNADAHTDPANLDAMEALVDELLRERCRAMGLAEGEEICRIELELAAAANDELAEEIRKFRRRVQEARRQVAAQNVVVQKLFVDGGLRA